MSRLGLDQFRAIEPYLTEFENIARELLEMETREHAPYQVVLPGEQPYKFCPRAWRDGKKIELPPIA